jgi:spermidine synthase
MLVMGACGIAYEYTLGVLGNNLMGSSHQELFVIIGIMMFAMGVGAAVQRRIDGALLDLFLLLEMALALFGGLAALAIYAAFVWTPSYSIILYAFAFVIGGLIGLEIPVLLRINTRYTRSLRVNLAEILSMDYVGALIGALLFAYVLVTRVSVGKIGAALGLTNALLALLGLIYFWPLVKRKRLLSGALSVILAVLGATFVWVDTMVADLEQRCYRDPIVHRTTSRYQHLVVTQRGDDLRFYINGQLQLASRDEAIYHEMLVHMPMAAAPQRGRVLILGGGDGMALREVLRYGEVREVVLVDIDPEVVRLFREDPDLVALNDGALLDARVRTLAAMGTSAGEREEVWVPSHLTAELLDDAEYTTAEVSAVHVDADRFVREIEGRYDVVIVDFPDPSSIELSKLYSLDLYRALADRMAPGAVVAIQSTSPVHAKDVFLAIGETLRAAGYRVLPYHENVPSFGEWGFHLAWRGEPSPEVRREGLAAVSTLPLGVRYVTPEVMAAALAFPRGWLHADEELRANTKMRPVMATYYRRGWR